MWFRDPFDNTCLLSCDLRYDRKKSANGFYSSYAKKLQQGIKGIQSDILQGRTPSIQVEIVRL